MRLGPAFQEKSLRIIARGKNIRKQNCTAILSSITPWEWVQPLDYPSIQ